MLRIQQYKKMLTNAYTCSKLKYKFKNTLKLLDELHVYIPDTCDYVVKYSVV